MVTSVDTCTLVENTIWKFFWNVFWLCWPKWYDKYSVELVLNKRNMILIFCSTLLDLWWYSWTVVLTKIKLQLGAAILCSSQFFHLFLCSVTKIRILDACGPPGLPSFLEGPSDTTTSILITALSFSPDGEVWYCYLHTRIRIPLMKDMCTLYIWLVLA
jgi:hypothetical protein